MPGSRQIALALLVMIETGPIAVPEAEACMQALPNLEIRRY